MARKPVVDPFTGALGAPAPREFVSIGSGAPVNRNLLYLKSEIDAKFAALPSGGGSWGSITGTLSAQTDLQTALNAKANSSSLGTLATLNSIDLTANVGATILPVANGGTGSATQNFVDLTATQNVGGAKTFTGSQVSFPDNSSSGFGFTIYKATDSTAHIDIGVGSITGRKSFSLPNVNGNIVVDSSSQTFTATQTFRDITFSANNTYNLGDSSHYAQYIYGSRLYLNSTAYLDGGTAGQTTLTNTMTGSSGQQYGVSLLPTANVSGTAGYTGLFMNLTESSFGSGGTLLIDIQKGSSSKFSVNTGGNAVFAGSMKSTQFIMGSDVAVTPVASGQSAVTVYWGLQLKGNYQNSVVAAPSNIGNKDDASVIIPNQQAAKVGLIIYGQTSQTGNLQEWRAVGGTSALTAIDSSGNFVLKANNIVTDTSTGTMIGTAGGASGQKLAVLGATPITQQLLATGAGHTVDDVITALQAFGILRQS